VRWLFHRLSLWTAPGCRAADFCKKWLHLYVYFAMWKLHYDGAEPAAAAAAAAEPGGCPRTLQRRVPLPPAAPVAPPTVKPLRRPPQLNVPSRPRLRLILARESGQLQRGGQRSTPDSLEIREERVGPPGI